MGTSVIVSQPPPCDGEMEEDGTPWCASQECTSSSVSPCGATSSATCFLDKYSVYLKRSSGTCEYEHRRMGGEDDVLSMPRVADLVERIGQGVLAVWLECKEEIDGGVGWRWTKTFPVYRYGFPGVHHTYIAPRWCRRRRSAGEGHGGKDGEHSERTIEHDHRESAAWC